MSMTIKMTLCRTVIFALALLASTASNAHGGWGYWGGGYYHGHGGGWGWGGGPGIVIGVPPVGYYAPQYYVPVCETIRVCNQRNCWLQRECN